MSRKLAEANADSWFILSAEYGLVDPTEIIKPYEKTLKKMGKKDRLVWAQQVWEKLKSRISAGDEVVFLAGMRYREYLEPRIIAFNAKVTVPMEGLRIGEQLSWLKERTR